LRSGKIAIWATTAPDPTMHVVAALVYWVIVSVWLMVLGTIAWFYAHNPRAFGTTRLLLAVLAIDAVRNVFENIYFGLYFGSLYGLLAPEMAQILGHPALLILPKLLNIVAGCTVLGLLLMRWLPLAVRERGKSEQRVSDLETLAAIDWLTGLYNRRHFEALARAELARSQRYMRPVSVLMIDIDHFKAVNDRFGHAAGDQVLRAVAALLVADKRDADVAARLGGEEFALLLPETTDLAAVQFAERLRQKMRNHASTVQGEKLAITISIGVAGATATTSGIEMLVRSADDALYDAKRGGRDRVSLWRPHAAAVQREAAE
jgi:diguanylate cyclase (GGDEF)-like protein